MAPEGGSARALSGSRLQRAERRPASAAVLLTAGHFSARGTLTKTKRSLREPARAPLSSAPASGSR